MASCIVWGSTSGSDSFGVGLGAFISGSSPVAACASGSSASGSDTSFFEGSGTAIPKCSPAVSFSSYRYA